MLKKGVKKYFVNPVLGLSIGILYILLSLLTQNVGLSVIISIIYATLLDVFLRGYTQTKISGLISKINIIPLTITLFVWLALRSTVDYLFYIFLFEIFVVISYVVARLSRIQIKSYLGENSSTIQNAFFDEFFEILKLTEYGLTLHLFTVLLYRFFLGNLQLPIWLDSIIYILIPIVLLVAIIVYQEMKIKSIVKQLRQEEWLPIVTENGEVTGRIAKSESLQMSNLFMHPVIRVALIHEGKIYLQKRSSEDILDPDKMDFPFEKYMLFNNDINVASRNCIRNTVGDHGFETNFLLKYVYENDNTKRLVFLFFTRPTSQDQIDSLRNLEGKFWTTKQIDENFADEGFFSECFELEYEYLKNTVLQADEIIRQTINS